MCVFLVVAGLYHSYYACINFWLLVIILNIIHCNYVLITGYNNFIIVRFNAMSRSPDRF